jgi:hypothetical protein
MSCIRYLYRWELSFDVIVESDFHLEFVHSGIRNVYWQHWLRGLTQTRWYFHLKPDKTHFPHATLKPTCLLTCRRPNNHFEERITKNLRPAKQAISEESPHRSTWSSGESLLQAIQKESIVDTQMTVIKDECSKLKKMLLRVRCTYFFSREDCSSLWFPHDDALILFVKIDTIEIDPTQRVKRILVDCQFSRRLAIFDQMGFSIDSLSKIKTPMVSFTWDTLYSLVTMLVEF